MNTRELGYFLTLAKTLHFGRASRLCHLSPSALTRCIQRMEDAVGKPLFFRDNRSVTLTPTGEVFRKYALQSIHDWERFLEEVHNTSDIAGKVTIYASVTAAYSILPNLIKSYRSAYPEVSLELRTGVAEESIRQVLSGEIDVSIAALSDAKTAPLEFLPLTTTDLVFVGSLSESNEQQEFDIAQTPLVVPRNGLARKRLDQWLSQHGIRANISTEVAGNEGILAMVCMGCGVGIIPELVLERSPFKQELTIIRNAPKLPPYAVGLCTTSKNLRRQNIQALWKLAQHQGGGEF